MANRRYNHAWTEARGRQHLDAVSAGRTRAAQHGIEPSLTLPAPKGATARFVQIKKLGAKVGMKATLKCGIYGDILEITGDGRLKISGLCGLVLPEAIQSVSPH